MRAPWRTDRQPKGVARVRARAFNVPSGPQPFALVVTAAATPLVATDALFTNGFE